MAHSSIVDLLAQRPEPELKRLREDAATQRQRLEVEIEQLDEALAKQSRKRSSKPAPSRPTPGLGTTRERVLRAIRRAGQASPAEIVAQSATEGVALKKGSVYNMLKALLDKGDIERVTEGVYAIAATNGAATSHSPGPSANGSATATAQASPDEPRIVPAGRESVS